MSLLSSLVGMGGWNLQSKGWDDSAGWTLGVLAAIGVVSGMGGATAHAQTCDPIQVAKLLASDGASRDAFGWSVAVSGDTAIIGSRADDDNGTDSGSVYVYTNIGGVWTQQAKLLPDDGEAGAFFGFSVSIDSDTALIGAWGDNDNGTKSGSAYIFTRSGSVWTQQAKLLPADGAAYDYFGYSVSADGDTVLIGAHLDDDNETKSGSVYIFTRSGDLWTQQAKLLALDGEMLDLFGSSVSLSGETALIGAWGDASYGPLSGSAYVFTRSGNDWTQQAKLLPDDGAEFDEFGTTVSLSGETAVIGAHADDENGSDSGSAYVFTRSGGVWTQHTKLLPDDGAANDEFGSSVAINGEMILIGAHLDDNNATDTGSAYLYAQTDGVWTQQSKVLPDDSEEDSWFGASVSLCGDTAVVGARNDNDNGHNSGSAYVIDLNCEDCPADLNGDGVVNTQDFLAFLGAWSAGEPLADWDGDGNVNTLDFLAYLTDWVAGC